MQRVVYTKMSIEGFKSRHVESIATNGTNVLYTGSNDGSVLLYNFTDTSPYPQLSLIDNLRKQYKDNKFVQSLQVIDSWHVLICIIDHIVTIYDVHSHAMVASITESKGCSTFTVHESSSTIAIANKAKLIIYKRLSSHSTQKALTTISKSFQFQFYKELSLNDTPRLIHFISKDTIVVGYKRHYEILNINTSTSYHILEFEKEHKMVCTHMPPTALRPYSCILSSRLQGTIVNLEVLGFEWADTLINIDNNDYSSTSSSSVSVNANANANASASSVSTISAELKTIAVTKDRIQWSSSVLQVIIATPFIVSLLADGVEVHDEASLLCLQKINIEGPTTGVNAVVSAGTGTGTAVSKAYTVCMAGIMSTSCSSSSSGNSNNNNSGNISAIENIFICSDDKLFYLKMVPLSAQVSALVDSNLFEQALSLVELCSRTNEQLRVRVSDIDVSVIHERYGYHLTKQEHDYVASVNQFILAKTDPMVVLRLFPDFLLSESAGTSTGSSSGGSTTSGTVRVGQRLVGSALCSAAQAVTVLCEHYREQFLYLADKADNYLSNDSSSNGSGSGASRSVSNSIHGVSSQESQPAADTGIHSSSSGRYLDEETSVELDNVSASTSGYLKQSLSQGDDGSIGLRSSVGNTSSLSTQQQQQQQQQLSPIEWIRQAQVLDYAYLAALVYATPANPAKLIAFVSLTSSHNRCRCPLESSTILVASQGLEFIEALLWLYRANNQHQQLLSLLSEDRCVGRNSSEWTRRDYYSWIASYLRVLWFLHFLSPVQTSDEHDQHTQLPPLVLLFDVLRSLLEYDVELGMSVLTSPELLSQSSDTMGNSTMGSLHSTVQMSLAPTHNVLTELLSFLDTVDCSNRCQTQPQQQQQQQQQQHKDDKKGSSKQRFTCPLDTAGVRLPLHTTIAANNALSVAYLEWLVYYNDTTSGGVSVKHMQTSITIDNGGEEYKHNKAYAASIHDEYAKSLLQHIAKLLEQSSRDGSKTMFMSPSSSLSLTTSISSAAASVGVDESMCLADTDPVQSSSLQAGDISTSVSTTPTIISALSLPTTPKSHDAYALNINEENDTDQIKLFKIYRKKLRHFLQYSNLYHPENIIKFIPGDFLQEFALILSKLNHHEEVLRIYIHQLNDLHLAEDYCSRIYEVFFNKLMKPRIIEKYLDCQNFNEVSAVGNSSSSSAAQSTATASGRANSAGVTSHARKEVSSTRKEVSSVIINNETILDHKLKLQHDLQDERTFMALYGDRNNVYICLFKVLLTPPNSTSLPSHQQQQNLLLVIQLAEKYFDRFDSNLFLDMMPHDIPFHYLSNYLLIVFEFNTHRKKTLQIVHQLLRVKEVNVRALG